MAGDNLRRSPSSRPATMLVIDGDAGLDLLLKKVIQEFDLGLTLCQISTRDLDFAALVFSPDIVLVNLALSRVCLYLLPEMQQLWPDARVIFVAESDDIHLYAEAMQVGAYDFLPKPLGSVEFGTILQSATQPARTKQRAAAT
jgi:DNA-binding NtrC family response regulator